MTSIEAVYSNPFKREICRPETDPVKKFYRHVTGLYDKGKFVVHTHAETDKRAIDVFGDDLKDVSMIGYTGKVGLWLATPDGVLNSDFFYGIENESKVPVVTNFTHNEMYEGDKRLEEFILKRLSHLGYQQEVFPVISTAPNDPNSLARGVFIHQG